MGIFNRRRHERSMLGVPAKLMVGTGRELAVIALDISDGGIALRVPVPVSTGQRCVVAVDLSIADRHKRFNAWGVSAYCGREGSAYRLGIAFVDVNARSLATLHDLQYAWQTFGMVGLAGRNSPIA